MTRQQTGRFSRRRQPKSFFGRLQQVLLRPVAFFQQLPMVEDSRHWLLLAILILGLLGYSAVRQQTGDFDPTGETDALVVGLQAILPMLLAWGSLTILLGIVTMLRGQKPEFGLNLRVAIWASFPFAIMGLLQLIRLFTGSAIGEVGLSGLFTNAQGWENFNDTLQIIILNATRHLTLFGIWQTILLWIGARHSLRGKWWAVLLMLTLWLLALILIPTAFDMFRMSSAPVEPTFGF